MLLKKRRANKRQVTKYWHAVRSSPFKCFADVAHAHKRRKPTAKQANGQASGVLVGVKPNDQQAKL